MKFPSWFPKFFPSLSRDIVKVDSGWQPERVAFRTTSNTSGNADTGYLSFVSSVEEICKLLPPEAGEAGIDAADPKTLNLSSAEGQAFADTAKILRELPGNEQLELAYKDLCVI